MADEDALRKIRAVEEQIEYLQKKLAMAKQVGMPLLTFEVEIWKVSYCQGSLTLILLLFVVHNFYQCLCYYIEILVCHPSLILFCISDSREFIFTFSGLAVVSDIIFWGPVFLCWLGLRDIVIRKEKFLYFMIMDIKLMQVNRGKVYFPLLILWHCQIC